jgi:hypothetical protein
MTTLETIADNKRDPLPDGWRWKLLQDLGEFESGGTPPKI